jgi:hypothetical protein
MTPVDPFDEQDSRRRERGDSYTWRDWQADGFRGPPPWRRGYQPLYWVLSIAVFAVLLAIFVIEGSRLH